LPNAAAGVKTAAEVKAATVAVVVRVIAEGAVTAAAEK
jgi:hypothetical protein